MINLKNDYSGIAHKRILEKLLSLADEQNVGYGLDKHSKHAEELIRKEIKCEDAKVYFLTGGTITNKVLISHILKTYEAVVSADSGHINVHETGTIEQSGHKIITVPHTLGKLNVEDLDKTIKKHTDFHMVKPKLVYITNATEYGTLYTLDELKKIYEYCQKHNLYLFLDGARLGAALTSEYNDIKIEDYAKYTDAFYIGGTKNGSILGEALVVINKTIDEEIRYSIKNCGGLYAKGFVTGICFETLFEDGLFYELASWENMLATKLINGLKALNVKFEIEGQTNQIFPIFTNEQIKLLANDILFELWTQGQNSSTIRFVTSYQTKEEEIDQALDVITKVLNRK